MNFSDELSRIIAERDRLRAEVESFRAPLQGGMDNDELLEAWQKKVPGVKPTQSDLRAFALGVEVGSIGKRVYFDERNSARDAWRRAADERERLRAEVEALRADAEHKRGLLLWALYHAQGGSSPVGQPIRRHLGIGQHDHMTPEQIGDAARAAQGEQG